MSGSLLRAEVHRFRSRRFIGLLLLLAVGAFVLICSIASTQFAKPDAETLRQAQERRASQQVEQQHFRDECLARLPDGQDPEQCGPKDLSELPVEAFIDKRPFLLATDGTAGAAAVSAGTAALLFVIGATWVGAEWSARTMVALLFWEPRRFRVLGTKLGVLLGAAAAIGLFAQALWLLTAKLLVSLRGTHEALPSGFYGDLLALQGRAVLLGVLIATFGFALANLVRNAGAALGVGFVYFAIVENFVRVLRPHWQPWLLTNNAAALVSQDGITVFDNEQRVAADGSVSSGREIVLSNLHGGLVLAVAAAVLVAVGAVLFQRRDLT